MGSKSRNKYDPRKNGEQEIQRRLEQMRRFWLRTAGCKLGPDSRGERRDTFDPNERNDG